MPGKTTFVVKKDRPKELSMGENQAIFKWRKERKCIRAIEQALGIASN